MDSKLEEAQARPSIGLVSLLCLVIGNMIGTGVYVSSGYSLADLKDAKFVLLVWLIAGIHAMCGAVAYAAAARRLPVSGGEYAMLSRWVHPAIGFLAAWISVVAGFAAPIALSGKLLGVYLLKSIDLSQFSFLSSDRTTLELCAATAAILLATGLHAVRMGWNATANNVVVAIKLLGVLIFIVWGISHLFAHGESGVLGTGASESSAIQLLWGILASLYFTTLCYTGFNASIYLAGSFAQPKGEVEASEESPAQMATHPVIGRSMIWACLIVTALYLVLNTIFLYSVPAHQIVEAGEAFVGTVARQIGGTLLEQIMNWVIILSTATSVLAMTITGPQVLLQLARDYRVGSKRWRESPEATHVALALQASITLLFVWSTTIRGVATYLGLTLTVCGALAIASLIIAAQRERSSLPTLSKIEMVCSSLYVLGALALISAGYWLVPWEFFASAITFGAGILLYILAKFYRARTFPRT
jgi:APA family basic amino acid/polyamine antiporter